MSNLDETYLIVGLRGLVLVDVVETIAEAFPTLRATTARTALDAMAVVATLKSVPFAFLNVDPDEFMRTELADVLARMGTRVVMMGRVAEENAANLCYDVLERPFVDTDILRLRGIALEV